MDRNTVKKKGRMKQEMHPLFTGTPISADFVRALPGDLLEPHPLVKELRQALQSKDISLAAKDRQIARLHVALTFGIKELPGQSLPRE